MSKRIRDLISQSKRLPYEHNIDVEDLVKLIVRECTDVCANFANTAPEAVIGAIGSAVKIKQHFGVEE